MQGGDYNNMGGLKPTKIIKTGNGVTAQNAQETANNGGAPAAGLSSLPVGDIATAIAQNTGLPANFIWAQLSHESDGGNSKLAREDHNYGGVKGTDGEYLHFDNDQQFIDYMSNYYPKYREDGIYDAQTADQFAEALQHGGYFTANLGEYEGGMHRYLEQAGLSDSGAAGAPAEKQSNANTMTQQQFGDMLNEKMIDFAGTNDDTVKTVFNDMSTSKDKALVALFAPYMQDGIFANTAANREALVGNDSFKKAMSMFLSKHLSDYAPAFENGRISFQQAEDALRPRHQQEVQAAQTVQAPNIQTTTTPQALIQMVQNGLNRDQQGALLRAAATALHTPQGMANGDEAVWMNKLAKAIDEHDYPTIAQMVPNESMQALSVPEQAQTPAKANELANNPVRSTAQGNAPVQQAAEAQKAAPKKQVDVTPLPTQETQQNEGVRIAQPQQTIDEQNAQMDARIAEVKKQPLAQREALGQQYLDALRQNNVSFSEKKLAKPLMDGKPEALEHVQRTYGDLLNTITSAEAAATSQHTAQANTSAEQTIQAIRNLPKEERLKIGRKYSKFLRHNNIFLDDANENYKLHTLLNYGHPEAIYQVQQQYGDQIAQKEGDLSTIPDDAIAAAKQADDGFSAPLNIFSSDEQATLRNAGLVYKDNNYNGAERVKVDPLFEEGDRRMKAARKAKAEAKASVANINQVKTQEETKSHESTQSKNQQEPDEGTKNQDQHAEPEPRKAAEPQPEAEAREVSATKKAADEGGQESKDETKLSAAEEQTLSGTSDEAKQVYTIVRDQLTTSKSKGAQCAASVGAAILARHADVYAKAYSKATGKKYTAMDYLNEKFGLNMTGQPIEGRAFNQAMSKSKATSLAEFAQIATSGEVDPNGKKKTFYSVNATNDIRVDFPIDDTRHSVNKHNLTGQQLQAIEDNLENIVSAYQDTKKKGHYGGLPVLAHIVTPIGDAGITFEFSPYGRVFVTTMFFDTKQNIENWAQKNGASRSLADDKSASSFTGHPLSISTIQQKLGIGNEKVYNQTAWHGSPHDFDQFDLGAIGTGEGA